MLLGVFVYMYAKRKYLDIEALIIGGLEKKKDKIIPGQYAERASRALGATDLALQSPQQAQRIPSVLSMSSAET